MKGFNRFFGLIEACAGIAGTVYIAAWLAGIIPWSKDIAFAAMGVVSLFFIADGFVRLGRGKSILAVRSRFFSFVLQTCFLTCLGIALFAQTLIISGCFQKSNEPADYAVIFGARVIGDAPSRILNNRISVAAEYLSSNPGAKAIACGGFSGGEFSEASVIARGLIERGIDPSRIILDESSEDTRQSVEAASKIIKSGGGSSAIAITSDYHVYRCMRLLRDQQLEVSGTGSPLSIMLRPIAHFRETLSLLRDFLLSIQIIAG